MIQAKFNRLHLCSMPAPLKDNDLDNLPRYSGIFRLQVS